MFTELLDTINIEIVKALSSVKLEQVAPQQKEIMQERVQNESDAPPQNKTVPSHRTATAKNPKKSLKVGRNDPCPCGSGKKYKQCHG
jgi:preprotein translocase subunit SecA